MQTQSVVAAVYSSVNHRRADAPGLSWTFLRGASAITCEVKLAAGTLCEVHVIPGWNAASAHVECADSLVSAMWRHAQIAKRLREAGWSLVRRSS